MDQLTGVTECIIRVPNENTALQVSDNLINASAIPEATQIIGQPELITVYYEEYSSNIFSLGINNDSYSISNGNNYLSLQNSSIFSNSPSNVLIKENENNFNIYVSYEDGFNLLTYGLDQPNSFSINYFDELTELDGSEFEIWVKSPITFTESQPGFVTSGTFSRFSDMNNLARMGGFVMTFTNPITNELEIITKSQNNFYTSINNEDRISFRNGVIVISPFENNEASNNYPVFQANNYQGLSHSRYTFSGIKNQDTYNGTYWWYPNYAFKGLNKSETGEYSEFPFYGSAKAVSFEIAETDQSTLQSTFYIRGNAQGSWLGYIKNQNNTITFVNCDSEGNYDGGKGASKLEISIYAIPAFSENSSTINFYIPNNTEYSYSSDNPYEVLNIDDYFALPELPDTTNGPKITIPENTNLPNNNVVYTLLGWSQTPPEKAFLSLNESANIYDYMDGSGSLIQSVKDTYKIIGNSNPDIIQLVNPSFLSQSGTKTYNLYAIYAVRGFDSVVSAQNNNSNIVGISDWKEYQGGTGYKSDREKWLGSINVSIYRDGESWGVNDQPMYFSYHNDDAADLNIKFIWQKLVDTYNNNPQNLSPLFAFMSDIGTEHTGFGENGKLEFNIPYNDTTIFPATSEDGHYTIDAVIADQGPSEDGLVYGYNWIQSNGGQLDNVIGGQSVQLYVTSIYDAKYYLVDNTYPNINTSAIDQVEGANWNSNLTYATPGTQVEFNKNNVGILNKVTSTNLNVLMDPQKTSIEGNNPYTFEFPSTLRGDYESFSYFIKNYENTIPLAPNPINSPNFPAGRSLASQSSQKWTLIAPTGVPSTGIDESKERFPYSTSSTVSYFPITGTTYGTGNTSYADPEFVLYAGEDPYTFKFYAFLEPKNGLTISKATSDSNSTQNFSFNLQLSYTNSGTNYPGSIPFTITNGTVNGSTTSGTVTPTNGLITFTLKSEGSVFFELPSGVSYTVTETNPLGYTPSYIVNGVLNGNTNGQGQLTNSNPNQSILVYNTKATGQLTVSKTVAGELASESDVFNFTITLKDETINGKYKDLTFTNGVATAKLSHGQSVTASGLPAGITYTVVENDANQNGYEMSSIDDEGTIKANETVEASFINTKNPEPEPGTGDLTVSKTVGGSGGDTDEEFPFIVTITDDYDIDGVYGEMTFVNGQAEFTLKHNESITANNLPEGISYQVVEETADQNGYQTTYTGDEGIIVDGQTSSVAFRNFKEEPNEEIEVEIEKYQSVNNGTQTQEYQEVQSGDTVSYFIIVKNTGNVDAQNVFISDPVPENLIVDEDSITTGGTYDSITNTVNWIIPTLVVNESVSVSFSVTVPSDMAPSTYFKNTAEVMIDDVVSPSNEVVIGNTATDTMPPETTEPETQPPTTGTTTTVTTSKGEPYTETSVKTTSSTSTSPKTGVTEDIALPLFSIITILLLGTVVFLKRVIKKLNNN